jgi:hypothetical protein
MGDRINEMEDRTLQGTALIEFMVNRPTQQSSTLAGCARLSLLKDPDKVPARLSLIGSAIGQSRDQRERS